MGDRRASVSSARYATREQRLPAGHRNVRAFAVALQKHPVRTGAESVRERIAFWQLGRVHRCTVCETTLSATALTRVHHGRQGGGVDAVLGAGELHRRRGRKEVHPRLPGPHIKRWHYRPAGAGSNKYRNEQRVLSVLRRTEMARLLPSNAVIGSAPSSGHSGPSGLQGAYD